jgi:Flp pilus assembly CpaF family ATPase
MPLDEVVRAAVAEVEDYNRVELLPIDDVGVAGQAVADVVHLLAELIENATVFSPPNTKVQVAGQAVPHGYVVEIEDRGLGMSDEELVELIQILGAYSGLSSRPFDTANPQLDLRLPDGSRLSAVMDVCRRPVLSIRRARLAKVFLSDLVGNGTLLPELAAMLSAAVAARKNLMIAGSTNAGKTTLLRALANEIPPGERLVTVERALELGIDQFPELHPNVVAFEERLPNPEGAGGISMAELVRRSLRMNPSRVIVGEVLGDEIVTMLNAMTQGNDGSLSTIHANSAPEVFNRIATYALQAQERLPVEATHMLIAGAIDFVIFIEKRNDYARGGTLRRFVSSVREVTGVDGRVLSSEVFAPAADGRAVPRAAIACLPELLAAGYEPSGMWG